MIGYSSDLFTPGAGGDAELAFALNGNVRRGGEAKPWGTWSKKQNCKIMNVLAYLFMIR